MRSSDDVQLEVDESGVVKVKVAIPAETVDEDVDDTEQADLEGDPDEEAETEAGPEDG